MIYSASDPGRSHGKWETVASGKQTDTPYRVYLVGIGRAWEGRVGSMGGGRKREKEWRPACLGGKGEIGSGSLTLKGTGYPGNRAGQHNYNYNLIFTAMGTMTQF